ncbi:MAG: TonB-dependent receptor [Bacteroidetes bacterium]|nr:TonB-dependent receptor [Bacteroidota bacterium]
MSRNKNYILSLLCLLFFTNAYGQEGIIKGKIQDAITNESLPFASVALKNSAIGTIADANGYFELKVQSGKATLVFSFLGYTPLEKQVSIESLQTIELTIHLSKNEVSNTWKPVVITAGRLEQNLEQTVTSMEVLPSRLLESRVENSLETAIEQVPGVTVIDGQANIRGGSGFSYGAGSRVLVMVDDLPMLAGDANDVKWNFIPIEQMEQVEVLKGASSALFGSSALNGVINMRTAMPGEKPTTILTLYTGIYDDPKDPQKKWWGSETQMTSGAHFAHRQKFKNLSVVLGAHVYEDEGYRQGETEKRIRANTNLRYAFEKIKGLTVGLAANVQQSKGGTFLIWQDDTTGAYLPLGGIGLPGSTLSEYTSERVTIDPYIIYNPGKWIHKLRMRYFFTKNENNTQQGATSNLYYAEYLVQRRIKDNINISVGASASETEVKGDLYDKQSGQNMAIYSQADGNFGKLNISVGGRIEQGKISGKSFDPQYLFRTGVSYQAWKGGFIRSSYGQGFRFPSIAEKFIRTQVGSIVIYPNDSLEIERGWSAEVGIKQVIQLKSWRGLADVSYFITEFKDMMEFTFGPWGKPGIDPLFGLGFKSVNIGNARISGFEINLAGEGKIGSVGQTILAGYTWIDPIQTDFLASRDTARNSSKENILKYRFRNLFKFDCETSYKKLSIGISGRYYTNIENIDAAFEGTIPGVKTYREQQPKDNWIFDARIGWQIIKILRCNFIVKNVLNEEFMTRPADLQAPRTYSVSLNMKIG